MALLHRDSTKEAAKKQKVEKVPVNYGGPVEMLNSCLVDVG